MKADCFSCRTKQSLLKVTTDLNLELLKLITHLQNELIAEMSAREAVEQRYNDLLKESEDL